MPVTLAQPIIPLSSAWTHQRVVNEVRTLTSELDNEKIQNSNLRNHINQGISYISDLLNIAQKPDYGVSWRCTLETTEHASGLNWIDLSTPVTVTVTAAYQRPFQDNPYLSAGEIIPHAHLWGIKNLTAKPGTAGGEQSSLANTWKGNCQLLSLAETATLDTMMNDQYRASIGYRQHGSDIILHIGEEITAAAGTAPTAPATYYERPKYFVIWGYRQALLDNMLPETTTASSWTRYVDLPDRHMRLLILLTQKMALEAINKGVDNGTEQAILAQIQSIQGLVQADVQNEMAERVKQKQGFSAR